MSEKDQIHILLADLAGDEPPVDIDLDLQIERGRRRTRRRSYAAAVAALAVSAVVAGGIITFRPDSDRSEAPVASPGTPTETPSFEIPTDGSTEKSAALIAQFRALAPELAQTPGGEPFNMQYLGGPPDGLLHAGVDWLWASPPNQVTVSVDVGRRATVPSACGTTKGSRRCTEVRHLPDRSIAYLLAYTVMGGGHGYDVRLDRPDGLSVVVSSAAQKPKGAKHDAPLSLERALEIARQITVTP